MSTIFETYPNLQVYYETSDGQKFHKEETAKSHAKSLKDKDVKTVKRPKETEGKDTKNSKSADDSGLKVDYQEVMALVPEMDEETANAYLANETKEGGKNRKSVVEALTNKIAELETKN